MSSLQDFLQFTALLMEVLAFILTVKYWKNLGPHAYAICLALGVIVSTECLGLIFDYLGFSNQQIYSIGISVIVFACYHVYFYKILESRRSRNVQKFIGVLFIINSLYHLFLLWEFNSSLVLLSYFFNIVLFLSSFMVFVIETFNSEKILFIKYYFPFWVYFSILFVYGGILPLIYLTSRHLIEINPQIFSHVLHSINILGYGILIWGIINSARYEESR